MTIGGEQRLGGGDPIDVVQPPPQGRSAGHAAPTPPPTTSGRRRGRHGPPRPAWQRMSFDDRAAIFLKAADLLAGPVADHARRGDHARPEQDLLPGRDRHAVRADRLLAVQRLLRPADPRRAAGQLAGGVEPLRPPPARGLRARDHAVQLHRDRRQPAHRAGADGQHRGVEAGADPAAVRALHDAAAGGRRAAARRDQHGHRGRPGGQRGRARPSRPGRHPLHRVDRDVRAPVATRSRRTCEPTGPTRAWSARPAARTSSSPTPPPTSTCCAPR